MPLTATVPRVEAPALKTTEPLTAPPNWPLMAAVNVIGWPISCGFFEDVTLVVVDALLTVSMSADEVLEV